MLETFCQVFWQLMVGHALADFSLQHDPMAKGKNRHTVIDTSRIPPGQTVQTVWPYWMTSHALIHGGAVAYITGSYALGAIETVAHWVIDVCKCENKYGIHTDQALHFACKVVYAIIYTINT
jgi:hypothetical protein